jgi:hypothetical protein
MEGNKFRAIGRIEFDERLWKHVMAWGVDMDTYDPMFFVFHYN